MTIICMHCKQGRQGHRGTATRSRVVETRPVRGDTWVRGRREATTTVQRVRECIKCRFRWRTRETVVPIRRKVKQ
jgi:hypothetical protein